MLGNRDDSRRRSSPGHRPPVPREHGAWVLVTASLVSPLVIAIVRTTGWSRHLPTFGLLVGISFGILFFREALRRWLRPRKRPRRLAWIAVGEALSILLLVSGLIWMENVLWAVAYLVVPAVVVDVGIRRRGGWPLPMGNEIAGVLSLSLAVPAGWVLFDIGGIRTMILLWLAYVLYHGAGLVRVQMALRLEGNDRRTAVVSGVGIHVILLAIATGGWYLGYLGPGGPPIFAIAMLYTEWRSRGERTPPRASLGQSEAALSTIFVVTAPWIIP